MSKLNKLFLITLITILCLGNSIGLFIVTSFPQIQQELGLVNYNLGMIPSYYFLFASLGSLSWSFFIEKRSRMEILIIGSVIWIGGIIFFILVNSLILILFAVALLSFGFLLLSINSYNTFVDLVSEKYLGRFFSAIFILQGSGALLGIIIAGIFEGIYGIHWKTLLTSILILILSLYLILIVIILTIKHSSMKQDKDEHSKLFEKTEGTSHIENIKDNPEFLAIVYVPLNIKIDKEWLKETLIKNKVNLYMILLLLIYLPINYFNNIWLQKYWIEYHQISQASASISQTFTSAGEFLGIITGGYIVDRIKDKEGDPLLKFGFLVMMITVPFFLIGYSIEWTFNDLDTQTNIVELSWNMFINAIHDSSIFISYTSLFTGFFFIQMTGPIFLNIFIKYNEEEKRPFLINLFFFINSFSGFLGPILGGWIADRWGFLQTLLLVPKSYFVSALFFIPSLYIQRRKRIKKKELEKQGEGEK